MSKRALFSLVLLLGIACFIFAASQTEAAWPSPPTDGDRAKGLAGGSAFFAAISAATAIGRTPGRWGERLNMRAGPRPLKRRWIWPFFMIVITVGNFIFALAVCAGNALVTSKKVSDGL
jgi:hypothetical protein